MSLLRRLNSLKPQPPPSPFFLLLHVRAQGGVSSRMRDLSFYRILVRDSCMAIREPLVRAPLQRSAQDKSPVDLCCFCDEYRLVRRRLASIFFGLFFAYDVLTDLFCPVNLRVTFFTSIFSFFVTYNIPYTFLYMYFLLFLGRWWRSTAESRGQQEFRASTWTSSSWTLSCLEGEKKRWEGERERIRES